MASGSWCDYEPLANGFRSCKDQLDEAWSRQLHNHPASCEKLISLGLLIHATVVSGYVQVAYARGNWQRPVWQGRFAGMVPAGSDDDSLVVVWLLLERLRPQAPNTQDSADADKGALLPVFQPSELKSTLHCAFVVTSYYLHFGMKLVEGASIANRCCYGVRMHDGCARCAVTNGRLT